MEEDIFSEQVHKSLQRAYEFRSVLGDNWLEAAILGVGFVIASALVAFLLNWLRERTAPSAQPLGRYLALGYPFLLAVILVIRGIAMTTMALATGALDLPVIGWVAKTILFLASYTLTIIDQWEWILHLPLTALFLGSYLAANVAPERGLTVYWAVVGFVVLALLLYAPRRIRKTGSPQ